MILGSSESRGDEIDCCRGCLARRRVNKSVAKARAASAVHMEGLMVADRLEISIVMMRPSQPFRRERSVLTWKGVNLSKTFQNDRLID